MIGGDLPWRNLTLAEVRGLVLQGFSASEIAWISGVSESVGEAMRDAALADMRREESAIAA